MYWKLETNERKTVTINRQNKTKYVYELELYKRRQEPNGGECRKEYTTDNIKIVSHYPIDCQDTPSIAHKL